MYVEQTLSAGVGVDFKEKADNFRLIESPTDDVTVIFYRQGVEIARAENMGAGYGERFTDGAFDSVRVTSTAGGAVRFVMRLGSEVRYDTPPNGLVTVTNTGGAYTRGSIAAQDATTAGTLFTANASRRMLAVQNLSASVAIRLRVDGTAPTTSTGIRIAAGGYWEAPAYCATGAVKVIAESGTANVEGLEG